MAAFFLPVNFQIPYRYKLYMNKYTGKCIVLAQIASDAGKYISGELVSNNDGANRHAISHGYGDKDKFIRLAIQSILQDKNSGFVFHVSDGGFTSPSLVYFNFKLGGERKQISFHSFDTWLLKFQTGKCRTRWDKGSSRETARELARFIGFEG